MDKTISTIWIESEHTGPMMGGKLHTDDNSDVIVTLTDGRRYVATLIK